MRRTMESLPKRFRIYLKTLIAARIIPQRGFALFDFQVEFLLFLFGAWDVRTDAAVKMARQVGKTTIMSIWLAYMIIVYDCQVVIVSTKESKTKKIARLIIKIMRATGRPIHPDGVGEARFENDAGFVCLSGRSDAQRESDSAHIVYIDEAQDIDYETVYQDLSPMCAMTNGIMVATGIGGVPSTFIEELWDSETSVTMNVPWQIVEKEKDKTIIQKWLVRKEKDRRSMLPIHFEAHYEGKRIPAVSTALIPYIVLWDAVYPDWNWKDAVKGADEVLVGIDWGKRRDASALIAVARIKNDYLMFAFDYYEGVGYDEQLDGIEIFLEGIQCNAVRGELNGVGDPMVDILAARLGRKDTVEGFWTDVYESNNCLKLIARASDRKRILYIDDGRWAERCVKDLERIGIKYTTNDITKATHSDWLTALKGAFYPDRVVKITEAA